MRPWLVIAAVSAIWAAVAPNPVPLVVLVLVALFVAQASREAPETRFLRRLDRKVRWHVRFRRLAGTIRRR